jgi:gentisate 1,2-dioxygenase
MATVLPTQTVHPSVEVLRADAHKLSLIEFSQARPVFELLEPPKNAVPHIWRWKDYYPMLRRAAGLLDVGQTFRRSFMFSNPALFPRPFMTPTLDGACSLYNPGERAPVHRHTPSASRLGIEGTGGFSTVQGEKCSMGPGDLVLTPAGTWHDFGNESDREALFIDIVNDPLCMALGATFYELDYRENGEQRKLQTVRQPLNHSINLYSRGGIVPTFVKHGRGWNQSASPLWVYRYQQVQEALIGLRSHAGDPYDGLMIEYVNPVTGGPGMPTMSFHMRLLRAQEKTAEHRHTSTTVYCAVEGKGKTWIGGVAFEWERNDVFVIPTWTWHCHESIGAGDAFLFSVSDEATMRKLGLYREQGRTKDDEVIEVIPEFNQP